MNCCPRHREAALALSRGDPEKYNIFSGSPRAVKSTALAMTGNHKRINELCDLCVCMIKKSLDLVMESLDNCPSKIIKMCCIDLL